MREMSKPTTLYYEEMYSDGSGPMYSIKLDNKIKTISIYAKGDEAEFPSADLEWFLSRLKAISHERVLEEGESND